MSWKVWIVEGMNSLWESEWNKEKFACTYSSLGRNTRVLGEWKGFLTWVFQLGKK